MPFNIKIGDSKDLKGIRCVIATADFEKGDIIEECPFIKIPKKDIKKSEKTIIGNYKYAWDETFDVLLLGYGSIYNHSYTPNADYIRDHEKNRMNYVAIKKISTGDEIFVNYNGDPDSKKTLDKEYTDFLY